MSNVRILNSLTRWHGRLLARQIAPGDRLLWIDVVDQTLSVCVAGEITGQYPVSTARKGVGCDDGSFMTPSGLHRVAARIGEGEPAGMIFKGRKPTGELAEITGADKDTGKDQITSRILWLSGLQAGINQGKGVSSYDRYIYIHGTNEEGRIGRPASHGCIRMCNDDVIALFEQVKVGMAVVIE